MVSKFLFLFFFAFCVFNAKGEIEIPVLSEEEAQAAHDALYNGGGNFGGDMMITGAQKASLKTRNAVNNAFARWPNGVIPYAVDNGIANLKPMIAQAAEHIRNKTNNCVRFVPRTNERDYVWMIYGNKGCWSWIGKQGGAQELHLGNGCGYFGLVVHEMLHAVGFAHEQNRADRDQHLTIFWDNIDKNQRYNFDILGGGLTYTNFDYNSIMLYGEYAFTAYRDRKTMEAKNKFKIIEPWQKPGMTDWDSYEVKRYYNCPA